MTGVEKKHMYELIKVAERTYYIDCPSKIGVYLDEQCSAYLIDSGSSKETGRKVRQLLDKMGWSLKAIINTHAHADHVGGNAYLQQQTGCRVFAPDIECAIARYPVLEPALLYGGFPHKDLRHKFLMAQESDCERLTSSEGVLPADFAFFPLPGHYFNMVGVRTPDDVAFIADCVSSEATLQKYKVVYLYDIAAQLETLQSLKTMKSKLFVPAHSEPEEDLTALAQANIDNILEIKRYLLSAISEPKCFDMLLREVFSQYELTMSIEQNALVGSTVKSFLTWFYNDGEAAIEIIDNILYWKRA